MRQMLKEISHNITRYDNNIIMGADLSNRDFSIPLDPGSGNLDGIMCKPNFF